jgi:aspartyl-tRNA synthetase
VRGDINDSRARRRPSSCDERRAELVQVCVHAIEDLLDGTSGVKGCCCERRGVAGTVRATDMWREVAVCGWVARRREHGEHLAFIDLRDHTGLVQCVVDGAADLRSEYVVRITGTVRQRPDGTSNENMPTGEIEVGDCTVEILNVAEPPPFQLNDRVEVDEMVRLAHRYVDLRTDRMQRNLRLRAKVNGALRRAMDDQGFVEIETPMLIASTPEGARDFVVPSRLSPG